MRLPSLTSSIYGLREVCNRDRIAGDRADRGIAGLSRNYSGGTVTSSSYYKNGES